MPPDLQHPLWRSAFRPFYLLGAAYAPWLMLFSLAVAGGLLPLPAVGLPLRAWHGHEIVFGFATAIIAGIVLTALPSWAGTTEITGGRLQWLAGLWLAGRMAMQTPLPPLPAAFIDCAFFPVMAAMLTPQLLRVRNRQYLWLLPILAGLFAANLAFHAGRMAGDEAAMSFGVLLAIYSIVFLYVLKGGVLTPIFTGNRLRETGRGGEIPFLPWLDVVAAGTVVVLAVADLVGWGATPVGLLALLACLVHAARLLHWQGWRIVDTPLLVVMHLGYAWLVAAFGLKAAALLTGTVPGSAWLHAFTVGALGMMMLGLMTRVSLRHTGRALRVPSAILAAWAMMFAAALLRVALAWAPANAALAVASSLLWAGAFVVCLVVFGPMWWQPSLSRGPAQAA